jgi:hypothetical protein
VAGDWRRLYSEESHNLYASPNIFRMIKLWIMKLAGYVARKGHEKCIKYVGLKT